MTSMIRTELQEFFRLMGDMKIDEAIYHVETDAQQIDDERKSLDGRAQTNAYMKSVLSGAVAQAPTSAKVPASEEMELATDARGKVLAIAAEVARTTGGTVSLDDVVAAVAKQGVDLSSTRPGTSIANILFKASALWERMSPGVFRLKP